MIGCNPNPKFIVMKILFVLILVLSSISFVRSQSGTADDSAIRSYTLQLTYNKTSTIVFPASIVSVDRGSRDVIVQRLHDVKNVLQLKANRVGFVETNLSVISSDGILRHFTVSYAKNPTILTIDLSSETSDNRKLLFDVSLTDVEIAKSKSVISSDKRRVHFTKECDGGVCLSLLGVYVKSDVMFYRMNITNKSDVDFNAELTKIYIRDKGRARRTASQEIEIQPISILGGVERIPGNGKQEIIIAIQKQMIPKSKYMMIELFEDNNGRHLNLAIKSKAVVNARLLQ